MKEIINEIRKKLDELEDKLNAASRPKLNIECFPFLEEQYVDLINGNDEEKLNRICKHIENKNINIIPSAKDSQIVRSAIVAALGEKGLCYWLRIRKMKDGFDEQQQTTKYLYLLSRRATNTMTFGAIVNRYTAAVDNFNNLLYQKK